MATAEIESTIKRLQNGELPVDFNWNADSYPGLPITRRIIAEPDANQVARVTLVSECLRDGLHGIETQPSVEEKLKYITELEKFGIRWATVGIFSGFDNKIDKNTKLLLREMKIQHPGMTPVVLTLATRDSLQWTKDCHKINPELAAIAFMGSASSRMLAEGWNKEFVLAKLDWLVRSLRAEQIGVIGATEHTTQTPPDFLKQIIETQINAGAEYFCIADTIGTARPIGTARIVNFVRNTLDGMGRQDVHIDWHGHRDTGNDVANAMAAVAAGVDRVHVVAGGVGERAGNIPLEVMAINFANVLKESNREVPWKLNQLDTLLGSYYEMVRLQTPEHGPLSSRAFVTSLGIHASAMFKTLELAQGAKDLGDVDLANKLTEMARTVYSAIDPSDVGRRHETRVSPWSGASNVKKAAQELGMDPAELDHKLIEWILSVAKQGGRELSSDELRRYLNNHH